MKNIISLLKEKIVFNKCCFRNSCKAILTGEYTLIPKEMKFVIIGDNVLSKNGCEEHYIGPHDLIKLYNVPKKQIRIHLSIPYGQNDGPSAIYFNDDFVYPLYPLEDGKYQEHMEWLIEHHNDIGNYINLH